MFRMNRDSKDENTMKTIILLLICTIFCIGCGSKPRVQINTFEILSGFNPDGVTSLGDTLILHFAIQVTDNSSSKLFSSGDGNGTVDCDVALSGNIQSLGVSQTYWQLSFNGDETREGSFTLKIPSSASAGERYNLDLSAVLSGDGSRDVKQMAIIAQPPQSYITVERYYISGGDNDGRLAPGEANVRLQILLRNAGFSHSDSLDCYVSSGDPDIAIVNGIAHFQIPSIASRNTSAWQQVLFNYGTSADPFQPAAFGIRIADKYKQTWVDTMRVIGMKGPKPIVSAWRLFEQAGNQDGQANPGEQIQLSFDVKDIGGWLTVSDLIVSTKDTLIQWNANRAYPIPELMETQVFTTAPADVSFLIPVSHHTEPIPLTVTITDEFSNCWVTEISVPVK